MEKIPTGTIRKITLGTNPKDGLTYVVGFSIFKDSEEKCSLILEDENNYHRFGIVRYWVYYKDKSGVEILWKSFSGVPVTIEYDTTKKDSFI